MRSLNTPKLTHERLKEVLRYDPITGNFYWLKRTALRVKVGSVAGTAQHDGRIHIRIDGEQFKANRLAYFYVHGQWPTHQILHLNGIKQDNRWENLEHATNSQNMVRRKDNSNNTSGHRNICHHKNSDRWQVQIYRKGKCYAKSFKNVNDAIVWRDDILAKHGPETLEDKNA